MTPLDFQSNLAMLLRDLPRGMTADLDDGVVAYWDGHKLVFAFLRDNGSGLIEEEFDLADFLWSEWAASCAAWLAAPHFSVRDEVSLWLKDAPPHDAG
ncbi:hypothetical protein [Trinickia violacea]|uniref:hypothetical protein n=1 Tax=Trinickia violacea TaxID=2571746 RepID=UPI0020C7FEAE|nr:hypothetical protein [Trinickia violacea]